MDINYKDFVMQSMDGYALHKIICDKNGTPIDYTFLEVNNAFEKYTGLKSCEIMAKTSLKFFRGLRMIALIGLSSMGKSLLADRKGIRRVCGYVKSALSH